MDEACKIVCAKHIHQCIWLPGNETHDKLRVTYSTTKNFDDDSLPTVLLIGPMFGGRWHAIEADHLAATMGIRVICVDRPGMGGATRVPLEVRIKVWLETVPALLSRLNVQHVNIITHSAGTMYTMNTIYHLRHFLNPKAPYVAFIAPWVHYSHSGALLWTSASKLPTGIIGHWSDVTKFVNAKIMPGIGWSGGIVSSFVNLFQAEPGASDSGDTDEAEKYGVEPEVATQMRKLQSKFFLAEDTSAANQEALLCLKKSGLGYWGACEDYEDYVRLLIKAEQDRKGLGDETGQTAKLKIEVYFAESDIMIGDTGREYFDKCFKQDGISDAIDYESSVLPDTNHETVLADFNKGSLKTIFEHITALHQL